MADGEPVRGLVRNPFPRRSAFLRRNTRGSRRARGSPKMNDTVAKRPYLAHQSSFAPSLKAVSQYASPIDEYTGYDSAYVAMSSSDRPQPAIYDIREVPDTYIYGFNGPYSDDGVDTDALQVHSKLEKSKRRSSTNTPQGYFLPPPVRLSPFPSFQGKPDLSSQPPSLSEGSVSPVLDRPATPRHIPTKTMYKQGEQHETGLAIQNIGWDDFRSSRTSIHIDGHTESASRHTPWPKSDKQVPPIAARSKFRENAPKKMTTKHALPSSIAQSKKPRKQSDMETLTRMHNFGKKLQVVYHQGPKGEGQKMWNGIRRKQKEKRELKPTQAPLKTARSPRTQAVRIETHKEQLNDLHAAALDMRAPKAPLISPPLQSRPKPSVPARPAPLGVLRSPVIHKPLPGTVPMKLRGSAGSHGQVSTTSTYTYHSWDVPVAASRSVQYDSRESIIDYSQSKARVPILDPCPKPRAVQKKGLPPRPVLAPGEKDPPELAEQEKMYKLRVGSNGSRPAVDELSWPTKPDGGLAFSTAPSKSQTNLLAGPSLAVSSQFPYVASRSHNTFAFLDDRQTERPRRNKVKGKEPKNLFAELASNFFDVPSQSKKGLSTNKDGPPKQAKEHLANLISHHKDKARLKQQQKLKEQISNPRPVLAPNNLTAKSSTASGGVGEPAAAVTVAPLKAAHAHGKANLPPPVPPLPADYVVQHSASQNNLHTKGKAKKEKKANWAVPFSRPRPRRDSDASMVCADARQSERQHQHGQEQKQRKHDSGALNMMTFKGPVRQQVEEIKVRDPGPPRQAQRYRYSDESLVPEPLGIRKSETARTESSFYRKYDSLIGEYDDSGCKGDEGRNGWF